MRRLNCSIKNLGHLSRLLTYCPRDSISFSDCNEALPSFLSHRGFIHIFLNNPFISSYLVVETILSREAHFKADVVRFCQIFVAKKRSKFLF